MSAPHDVFEDPGRLNREMRSRRQAFLLEKRIVRQLLGFFHLEHKASELDLLCAGDAIETQSPLEWFSQCFPTFPTRLSAEKVNEIHTLTTADLLGRFAKTSLFEAFRRAKERLSEKGPGPCGLVFEWFGDELMIIHDDQRFAACSGNRFVYPVVRKGRVRQVLVVEEFRKYLGTLGWSPDGGPRGKEQRQRKVVPGTDGP